MVLNHNIHIQFIDQERQMPIPDLLVHLNFYPSGQMPVYFKPRLTDKSGAILLNQQELHRIETSEKGNSELFFCDLPDTRKQDRFEIRVLNPEELNDDLNMKKLFSAEIAHEFQFLIDQAVNQAYMGRRILADPQSDIEVVLTRRA